MAKYEIKDGVGIIPEGTTKIEREAFKYCQNLTNVVIPDSVTEIGVMAFKDCTGLTSIVIPDSVTKIGGIAFDGCTGLTSIVVSEGNKVLDSRNNCNAIIKTATNELIAGCKNTVIPDSVTEIGSWAFYGCTGLTSIVIPDSVTEIDGSAFSGCTGLTSIVIPDSVTEIGSRAFYGCTGLTSIVIPDSVTEIDGSAFSGCTGLTSIVVSEGNKVLDSRNNCNGIIETATNKLVAGCKNTAIPNSVTEIGKYAFKGCTGLTSIIIPDSVTEIGGDAFEGCTGLTSIVIPDSVTEIGDDAFEGCTGLTSIVIPDSVTVIGYHAFQGCTGLTSIVIPDSVTKIGDYAFHGCTGLTSIVIPDSVTEIGWSAFYGCTGLTSIVIPDSVTKIGKSAFYGCTGLTSIVIPDSVTKIGEYAFSNTGLTKIVVSKGNKVFDSRYDCNAIIDTENNILIFGCQNTVIPDSVTEIGDSAFGGCTGLTSIVIPELVTKIGERTFSYCKGLKSVIIESKLKKIPYGAFLNCSSLESITLPVGVSNIEKNAFDECNALKTINVPAKKADYYKQRLPKKLCGLIVELPAEKKKNNKNVKINKLLSEQDKRIFNLLGVPDLPYHLRPMDSSEFVTLLFNLQEKTRVRIETADYDYYRYYALDDKPLKRKKLDWRSLEIDIQKGIHIVRLITRKIDGFVDRGPVIEPACEVMLIDDNYSLDRLADNTKGVKHLILGANCHIKDVYSIACLPHSRISVVPENQWLEYRDGCIIDRETQKLLLVNSEVKKLPDGISGISNNALRRFNNERLVIPFCSQTVSLERANYWSTELGRAVKAKRVDDGLDHVKELVFEEGIEKIKLYCCSFCQDIAIAFPKTLNKIGIQGVTAEQIRIPVSCNLETFRDSCIGNLEFLGDVKLRPDPDSYHDGVFDNFSGNIRFHGEVSLFPKFDPDEDKMIYFIGKLNDDCTITVSSQAIADAIKSCKDFNPNVKVIVELPAEKKKK